MCWLCFTAADAAGIAGTAAALAAAAAGRRGRASTATGREGRQSAQWGVQTGTACTRDMRGGLAQLALHTWRCCSLASRPSQQGPPCCVPACTAPTGTATRCTAGASPATPAAGSVRAARQAPSPSRRPRRNRLVQQRLSLAGSRHRRHRAAAAACPPVAGKPRLRLTEAAVERVARAGAGAGSLRHRLQRRPPGLKGVLPEY